MAGLWMLVSVSVCLLVLPGVLSLDDEYTGNVARTRRDVRSKVEGTLRIVTIQHEPYTTKKGDQFYGFIPDLVKKLSRRLGFEYEFYMETKYGSYDDSSMQWNGMIGEVIKNEKNASQGAHIAAAAITITAPREAVVDFVNPFQNLGLTMVIKKPHWDMQRMMYTGDKDAPFDFSILQPLAWQVWLTLFFCIIMVGVSLWLTNKYNPYEWAGLFQAGQADREQAEVFSLPGSLWFAFTSLQWQGFERAPRSIGARVLTVVWFAFVTILLVTYTGGIVNNLYWASMVHNQDPLRHNIHSLAELVSDPSYDYGTLKGGSTETYLKRVATGAEYRQMLHYLESDRGRESMVDSVEEGLKKVRSGRYALLLDSMQAKFETNRLPCDIMTVGTPFALRSYGMAVAQGSPILEDLHTGILELVEDGEIEALEDKWFVGDEGQCWNVTRLERYLASSTTVEVNKPKAVTMKMFWAPLVMLIAGILISGLISVGETLWYRKRGQYKPDRPEGGIVLKMEQ